MKAYRLLYPIWLMAKVLKVSRSGFYKWLIRKPSRRDVQDAVLKSAIRSAHDLSRASFGPRRLQTELQENGYHVGRDRIDRLRKQMVSIRESHLHFCRLSTAWFGSFSPTDTCICLSLEDLRL